MNTNSSGPEEISKYADIRVLAVCQVNWRIPLVLTQSPAAVGMMIVNAASTSQGGSRRPGPLEACIQRQRGLKGFRARAATTRQQADDINSLE